MKKQMFKYHLGDRVMIIGRTGLCVVTGRGSMEFISGGNLNMYQLGGACVADGVPEHLLMTPEEAVALVEGGRI